MVTKNRLTINIHEIKSIFLMVPKRSFSKFAWLRNALNCIIAIINKKKPILIIY